MPASDGQPKNSTTLRKSAKTASEVIMSSREVSGTPRQIVIGALLATSFAFLIALLNMPHLDSSLTVAALAFAAAILFLSLDFIIVSVEFKPGVHEFFVIVMKAVAFFVYEALGGLGVIVGIVAVFLHLSSATIVALVISVIIVIAAFPAMLFLIIARLWVVTKPLPSSKTLTKEETEEIMRKDGFLSLFVPSEPLPPAPPDPQPTNTLPSQGIPADNP